MVGGNAGGDAFGCVYEVIVLSWTRGGAGQCGHVCDMVVLAVLVLAVTW